MRLTPLIEGEQMSNPNYTHIELVVDESGSMAGLTTDTVQGVSAFISGQKETEGRVTISLTKFNVQPEEVYHHLDIGDVPEFIYRAGGGTALLDAIGTAVNNARKYVSLLPKPSRPAAVTLVICTDGEENSSKRWNKSQIKELLQECQTRDDWQIIFMGANIDAFAEASTLGIYAGSTLQYAHTNRGTHNTWAAATRSTNAYRGAVAQGMPSAAVMDSYSFTSRERAEALEETPEDSGA